MSPTVLAIDDSPSVLALLEALLLPEGITLHRALSADVGLRLTHELRPDLILLDMELPGISGFRALQQLKSSPETQDVPVIFLTGKTDVASKVRAFDLGAVDYVTKPFEPAELQARVRAAIRTRRYQQLLATRAQIDGLTGLFNRAYLDRRLDEELAASARYGRKLSVVLLDADRFKALNDTHGHLLGDRVLQGIAEALAKGVRATDAACRFGGEEFALVLSETPGAAAWLVAERLRASIARLEFATRDGARVTVTASFGVASTDRLAAGVAPTRAGLVEAADGALYEAKRSGRDRVCMASGREREPAAVDA